MSVSERSRLPNANGLSGHSQRHRLASPFPLPAIKSRPFFPVILTGELSPILGTPPARGCCPAGVPQFEGMRFAPGPGEMNCLRWRELHGHRWWDCPHWGTCGTTGKCRRWCGLAVDGSPSPGRRFAPFFPSKVRERQRVDSLPPHPPLTYRARLRVLVAKPRRRVAIMAIPSAWVAHPPACYRPGKTGPRC